MGCNRVRGKNLEERGKKEERKRGQEGLKYFESRGILNLGVGSTLSPCGLERFGL